MDKTKKAFTLVELLVSVAIICILAAILFPVFKSGIRAARKTVCLSNMHQVYMATTMYLSEYDDMFMPVNYRPGETPDWKTDRTWVQMILPYAGSQYEIFRCPEDPEQRWRSDASFDEDLVPTDMYSRYYSASMRSNVGYNYLYLSPIYKEGTTWVSTPRAWSSVEKPSRMVMFVDSIWDRLPNGRPVGGGNWLVVPPCRYVQTHRGIEDSFQVVGKQVFARSAGWNISNPLSADRYGGAWPWHGELVTFIRVDGSASTVTIDELAQGCNVESNWRGYIEAYSNYIWDMK